MLTLADQITAVSLLVTQFDASTLPDAVKTRFQTEAAQISPVVRFANIAELMYANMATVGAAGQTLGAQCAHLCRLNGWHSLGDPRGYGIVKAFSRELGETAPAGTTWPDPADDPEVQPSWVISA